MMLQEIRNKLFRESQFCEEIYGEFPDELLRSDEYTNEARLFSSVR